jgi:hypothetical protein
MPLSESIALPAIESVFGESGAQQGTDDRVLATGSPAICTGHQTVRPEALRPRLATGLPKLMKRYAMNSLTIKCLGQQTLS